MARLCNFQNTQIFLNLNVNKTTDRTPDMGKIELLFEIYMGNWTDTGQYEYLIKI